MKLITCAADGCDVQVYMSHPKQKYCGVECKESENSRRRRKRMKAAGVENNPYVNRCPVCDAFYRCRRKSQSACSHACRTGAKRIANRDERKRMGREKKERRMRHQWELLAGVKWKKHITMPVCRACPDCGNKFLPLKWKQRYCDACVVNRQREQAQEQKRKRRAIKSMFFPLCDEFASKEIYERDEYICQICGVKTDPTLQPRDSNYPNLDHIIPLSKGGLHLETNVQCLCRMCNSIKSARSMEEARVTILWG